MTKVQKLQAEIDEANANRKATTEENTVNNDAWVVIRRPYAYKNGNRI